MSQPAPALLAVLPALRPIITADSFESRRKALRVYLLKSLSGLKIYFTDRLGDAPDPLGTPLQGFDCTAVEVALSSLLDAVRLVSFIESGDPSISDMQRNSLFRAWQEHVGIDLQTASEED